MIGGREGVQKFSFTIFFKRKKKEILLQLRLLLFTITQVLFFCFTVHCCVFFPEGVGVRGGALCGSHEGPGSLSFEERAIGCLKKSYSPCDTSVFFITQPSIYK